MFNPVALFGAVNTINMVRKLKSSADTLERAFRPKQSGTKTKTPHILTPQQQWEAKLQRRAKADKLEAAQLKKNANNFQKDVSSGKVMKQLFPNARTPVNPVKNNPVQGKYSKALNANLDAQQKNISKGLNNPTNYENKIKNIMGVN